MQLASAWRLKIRLRFCKHLRITDLFLLDLSSGFLIILHVLIVLIDRITLSELLIITVVVSCILAKYGSLSALFWELHWRSVLPVWRHLEVLLSLFIFFMINIFSNDDPKLFGFDVGRIIHSLWTSL